MRLPHRWRAANKRARDRWLEKDPRTFKLAQTVRAAAHRAKRNHLSFDLSLDYILSITGDVCPVLGIPFNFTNNKKRFESSPSIDRFLPELGYVKGNVFIISNRANTLKSTGTLVEHIQLTYWMTKVYQTLHKKLPWDLSEIQQSTDNVIPLRRTAKKP
jgi:hypothetical protein